MPAHGKSLAAIEHPGPVHALIDFCGEVLDFLIGEILARGENAAQENRRIDGRKFALFPAGAGFHVDKVEEEAVFVVQIVGDKSQGVPNAVGDFRRLSVAAVVADAQTGQAESCGGDARHHARVVAVGESAIFHLAALGAGLVPKKLKTGALDFIKKLLVGSFKWSAVGLHERRGAALLATGNSRQRRGQEAHPAKAHHFPSIQKSFARHGPSSLLRDFQRGLNTLGRVGSDPYRDFSRLGGKLLLIIPDCECAWTQQKGDLLCFPRS